MPLIWSAVNSGPTTVGQNHASTDHDGPTIRPHRTYSCMVEMGRARTAAACESSTLVQELHVISLRSAVSCAPSSHPHHQRSVSDRGRAQSAELEAFGKGLLLIYH